jgi:hypothetical protein
MPIMVRPKDKATKLAYRILGKPANIQNDKSAFNKRVKRKLQYEESRRSK